MKRYNIRIIVDDVLKLWGAIALVLILLKIYGVI